MNLSTLCTTLVNDAALHCKWLNTLSLMENTGARKISASEDSSEVDLTVLKHAAEEFRHAYYLKKLIARIDPTACPTYAPKYVLAAQASRHYLHRLDLAMSRLMRQRYPGDRKRLKTGAYILVTYAIEVRADVLYGSYQQALDAVQSRVNVKSIIAEEEGHLEEMHHLLEAFDADWRPLAEEACGIEEDLFNAWLGAVAAEVVRDGVMER